MFWQKRPVGPLTGPIAVRLSQGRAAADTSDLRMVEEPGTYAGRRVTYFRVFDPAVALAAGIGVRTFHDLDGLAGLRSGHTERDGSVVLNQL